MPRTSRVVSPPSRRALAAGTVALLAMTAVLIGSSGAAGQTATAKAVQSVVLDALHAEHELANLPASASEQGVSAALRGQMVATARSVIDKLYFGPIKDARTETIVGGLELEGTAEGIFVWDGGVHDITFRSTFVDASKATVVAQATTYLVVSTTQDGERTRPESTALHTFQLVLQQGQWYVADEEIDFLPGEGP